MSKTFITFVTLLYIYIYIEFNKFHKNIYHISFHFFSTRNFNRNENSVAKITIKSTISLDTWRRNSWRKSSSFSHVFRASIRSPAQWNWRRMQNRGIITVRKKRFKVSSWIALELSRRKSLYVGFQCDLAKREREREKNEADERHIFSRMHSRRRYFPIDRSWREHLYFHRCAAFRMTLKSPTMKLLAALETWVSKPKKENSFFFSFLSFLSVLFSCFCFDPLSSWLISAPFHGIRWVKMKRLEQWREMGISS